MHADSADTSWPWLLREGLVPILGLAVIVWVASVDLSVIPVWSSEPTYGAGSSSASSRSSERVQPSDARPDVPLVLPVAGTSTADLVDTFEDPRSGGRTHHAIDIIAPQGANVVAAAAGTVMKRGTSGRGGKSVYVVSPDTSFVYYYAHLSAYGERSAPGTDVKAGDPLGTVGQTGNATTAHLHFAIWQVDDLSRPWSRRPVNPYPLLED